ncbi:arrestin domain-containing protein 17 [Drosophila grimshawi]|uniref:GH18161 n=1 Tax=Drosophila grimshawi TaxID=7222 RepID=B4JG78_DROGR|nr:arrestin domain-containing protein 17 [Drosophila grimshawi]XP_032593708.1 arrestin domain-containing protein 17 [Drosophila grimshawi]EDV93645.1 GH18161 [Drosophila grimshawi]
MESERLCIRLDNPDRIFYAGQVIRGDIWMNLTKRTKIRAIKIQVTGKGKCKWMEILRKNSNNNEYTRSLFYTSKEIYEHSETPLPEFEPRGLELSPGEHTFTFNVALGHQLPSSFRGSYGSIKYKMRILIQRPWTFDQRHTIPFTVVKNMPLPATYRSNPTPLEKQITKTISLFGTRPITMLALLPEDFAVRGEPLRICVTVVNNSTTNVEKLRFNILQYITYYSHVPLRVQKVECIAIANKETGAVAKKSERSFAHELLMPDTAQPTDEEYSGIITISYELRVEAVLRGFFKNLVLNLPFKVYSQDVSARLGSMRPSLPPRPDDGPPGPDDAAASVAPGNPFEPSAALSVYPALDSSIGSPSHSSQYSECSSLNSTTSDSTLSPAVGGVELSYTSYTSDSQSSQFGSPSARASLRSNCNVPYMPYSSSPLMVQSYPPPHLPPYPLPDSPQYTLLALPPLPPPTTATGTSSTAAQAPVGAGYSQLPSTSAASGSLRQTRQSAGAHALPPSYDELFGNANAPPESPK